MKKLIRALLILVACFFICTAFSSCAGNSFANTADKYFSAFEQFDYETMYSLLTPSAAARVDEDEFIEYHKKVYDLMKFAKVKVTKGEQINEVNKEVFNYTATFESTEYGAFSFDMQLEVYKKTKFFLVEWSPANVVPDMMWDDKVYSTTLYGNRGEIFDREGRPVVINDYAVTVYAQKGKVGESVATVLSRAADILGSNYAELKTIYDKASDTAILASMLKGELTQAQEDELGKLEGIGINRTSMTPIRYYPYKDAAAQTLGYSTPVEASDRSKEQYALVPDGTRIGRTGIEYAYDSILQPGEGKRVYLISADAKKTTVLFEKPAPDGQSIKLTIDIVLQSGIHKQMNETYKSIGAAGTVTVVEPTTGAVKAMVSYPSYDANIYAFPSPRGAAALYEEGSKSPTLNRSTQGLYAPGSILKSLVALMGLDSGKVTTTTVFPYENQIEYLDYERDRWRPSGSGWSHYIIRQAFRTASEPKGNLDMRRALTWSDNIYFGWLAMKMGKDIYVDYMQKIGVGESLPFDISVKPGQIANDLGNLDSQKMLADSGFGQGEVLFTPIQLASSFSLIGNNGTIMQPYIVQSLNTTNEQGELTAVTQTQPKVFKQSLFTVESVERVRTILENTAFHGTGKSGTTGLSDMRIGAKTGTAQTGNDVTEIGWYAGLIISGGEPDAILVQADAPKGESKVKFQLANYVFKQLKYEGEQE